MKPEELDAIEARAALTARESRSGAATAHDVPALVTALRDAWRERDEALAWWNETRANVETANNVRAERDAALSNLAKAVEALREISGRVEVIGSVVAVIARAALKEIGE